VAWLLAENRIVAANAVIDPRTLPEIQMPARDRFVDDDRTGGKEFR
jgi:S-disulfanyl-L-cysteine oxidoreductase SoxD